MTIHKNTIFSTAERREQILMQLDSQESISVHELSRRFNVSSVTIRKDLDFLALEGKLERIHGGAVKNIQLQQNQSFMVRINQRKEAKKQIASSAAKLVSPGDSIILNSGSTAFYVAQELKGLKDLLVITNAFHTFSEVGFCRNISTVFLGGRFDPTTQLTYDEDAISQLSRYKADILFMGMDGVDPQSGATTYEQVSASILKQMLKSSKKNVLIADGSKIGKTALVKICPLENFHVLITNRTPQNESLLQEIARLGVEIIAD